VNPYLAVALLLLIGAALFMLPLAPALVELRRKSDATPLDVIQQHAGEIRHFAESFRSYLKNLEPVLQARASSSVAATGTLPDGTDYLLVRRGDEVLKLPLRESNQVCPVLLAASTDLLLPSDTTFSKEIYVAGHFGGGKRGRYRAILGEKEVHLGSESSVMRWAHAVGKLRADQGCKLYGRVSSDRGLYLQRDCSFQRLNAPRVEIGPQRNDEPACNVESAAETDSGSSRLLLDGNFAIDPGGTFRGNLVVRGSLRIGAGARVFGDIKGNKKVILHDGVSVQGSLMSAREMRIGANCAIRGPIISERFMQVRSGTRCGSPEHATTVSAPWIEVEEGVVVFGTLWARERGQVVKNL